MPLAFEIFLAPLALPASAHLPPILLTVDLGFHRKEITHHIVNVNVNDIWHMPHMLHATTLQ